MSNLDLQFRPLRPGTSIINARVNEPGTLGLFGQDDTGAPWLISCYHVLCDAGLAQYGQDELIYQPAAVVAQYAVGRTNASRASVELDCAAALLLDGTSVDASIPGFGPLVQTATATVNMRVAKVGAAGGLTEGIITQVIGTSVVIRTDAEFPQDYVLSQPGDSGALWMDRDTRAAIALHRGLRTPRTATATSIDAVLQILDLRFLAGRTP